MFHVFLVYFIGMGIYDVKCCMETTEKDIKIEIGDTVVLQTSFKNESKIVDIIAEHESVIEVTSDFAKSSINLVALNAGKSEVSVVCDFNSRNESKFLLMVRVRNSKLLDIISIICGWLYFLCWSLCFYPQIYENYKTKSVVGLNLDTVVFGCFGYLMYNTFNMALFYSEAIQEQYSERYPKGIPPVLLNDLVFSMHGVAATALTSYQCLIYFRGKQTVSTLAIIVMALCSLGVIAGSIMALNNNILWLDVAYFCSYIKMYGNVLLYFPQVYTNHKRRSTEGFSIVGVIIDMFGGILSMIQLFMDGYNYDDWKTVFENPAKFGISAMTLLISVVFILQHYVFYREHPKSKQEQKFLP